MHHRLILRFSAICALIIGLSLMLIPDAFLGAYGFTGLNLPGRGMAMLFGAVLSGFAIMNWAASTASVAAEIHYVLIGNVAANTLCFIVTLFRQLSIAAMPPGAWINVILSLIFACLFGYLYMASPAGYRLHAGTRSA